MNPPRRSSRPRRSRRRTRLTADEVRSRLYEGALDRFRAQGYDGTSVSELTREAGVAKGTFFNHFPTKEHILASWFRGIWEEERQGVATDGSGGAPAIGLLLGRVIVRLDEDRILAGALASRIADLPGHDRGHDGGDETVDPPITELRRWVEGRIRESLPIIVPIRPVDDADLAALIAGAFQETLREVFLAQPAPASARVAKRTPDSRGALARRVDFLLASSGLLDG